MEKPNAIIGVDTVNGDDYCVELRETNRVVPLPSGGTARHRLQIIWFYKNGRLHEYQYDMGPAENFTADQFSVLGGIVDGNKVYQEMTIDEVRWEADSMRWNKPAIDIKDWLQIN